MLKKPRKPFLPYFLLLVLGCITSPDVFSQTVSGFSKEMQDFDKLPAVRWAFTIASPVFSSPVVSDGLAYFGGLDSLLYAVEIKTGKEAWRFRTKGPIRSSVCIGGSRLYLNGGDGVLYSLEKRTGKLLWSFNTGGERQYDFADYFHSTPVLSDGILYFGSGDGNLYAVNVESETRVWAFKTGDVVHSTPAIDDGKVFFGSFDGYIYALNLSDGSLAWKFKTVGHRYFPAGEVQGSPAVFNNLIIIGARDYNVYALDQQGGFCHWNKAFTRGWGLCTNIHDSVLYIGSSDERVLIAADPATGKEFWKKDMEFLVFGNNAYSNSMMYLGTTIGKLHGISMRSGEKVWSFETDSYKRSRYTYFKEDDSYRDDIYSIIKSNEHFLEVECELGGIFTTPCISGDDIIFSSTNGTVYCLGK